MSLIKGLLTRFGIRRATTESITVSFETYMKAVDVAAQINLRLNTAQAAVREAEAGQAKAEGERDAAEQEAADTRTKLANLIAMRDAALRELKDQVALNAELLQQGFGVTVDMQGHSALVDSSRYQVLTQFTGRSLDLRKGLLDALMSPFAYNVAKHMINKLRKGGDLREGVETLEKGQALLMRPDVERPAIEA